jgi:hypothetical protein
MVAKLIRINIGEWIPQRFATNYRTLKSERLGALHQLISSSFLTRNAIGHGEATDFAY